MGVVNLTPNSFSDGGLYGDPQKVHRQIDILLENEIDIIDLGAESTAPFNDPTSKEQELDRFEKLFFSIENIEGRAKIVRASTSKSNIALTA